MIYLGNALDCEAGLERAVRARVAAVCKHWRDMASLITIKMATNVNGDSQNGDELKRRQTITAKSILNEPKQRQSKRRQTITVTSILNYVKTATVQTATNRNININICSIELKLDGKITKI